LTFFSALQLVGTPVSWLAPRPPGPRNWLQSAAWDFADRRRQITRKEDMIRGSGKIEERFINNVSGGMLERIGIDQLG
jgi:hypothetical protein